MACGRGDYDIGTRRRPRRTRRRTASVQDPAAMTAERGVTGPSDRGLRAPTRPSTAKPADSPPAAIDVVGLTKRFGRHVAVDDFSMTVPAGAIAGFVGPNGAGKTTTMRMLLGLVTPNAGTGTVLGHPLSEPHRYLHRVGALVESPAFYPSLTGRQNLRLLARLGGLDPDRVNDTVDIVGLTSRGDDAYRTYSLGMKQRLGIAAALLPQPDLLLLDEPANGLDPAGIRSIRELLVGLAERGTTILVASHLLAEVEALCSWMILIDRGRRVYQGPVEELGADGRERLVVRTVDPGDLSVVEEVAADHGYTATRTGDRIMIDCPADFAGTLNAETMRRGGVICELALQTANLEERFFAITGEELP
jgi:ABC-2 type transport system ATP-binding protein